jgi:hypothetical protein
VCSASTCRWSTRTGEPPPRRAARRRDAPRRDRPRRPPHPPHPTSAAATPTADADADAAGATNRPPTRSPPAVARRPLLAYVKSISGPRDLAQIAWNFINDSLRTTVCLQYAPRCLAAAAARMASQYLDKVKGRPFPLPAHPKGSDGGWYRAFQVRGETVDAIVEQIMAIYSSAGGGAGAGLANSAAIEKMRAHDSARAAAGQRAGEGGGGGAAAGARHDDAAAKREREGEGGASDATPRADGPKGEGEPADAAPPSKRARDGE